MYTTMLQTLIKQNPSIFFVAVYLTQIMHLKQLIGQVLYSLIMLCGILCSMLPLNFKQLSMPLLPANLPTLATYTFFINNKQTVNISKLQNMML